MSYIIVLSLIAAALFGLSYVAKRRFGVLVLALVAGGMLATMWTETLTPIVASVGLVTIKPPLSSLVAMLITLLPAFILFMGGPVAHASHERIYGSLVFAVTATVLVFRWLNDALVIDGPGMVLHDFIRDYQAVLLTVCVIAAIFDVLMTHTARRSGQHARH